MRTAEKSARVIFLSLCPQRGSLPPPHFAVGLQSPPHFVPGHQRPLRFCARGAWSQPDGLVRIFPQKAACCGQAGIRGHCWRPQEVCVYFQSKKIFLKRNSSSSRTSIERFGKRLKFPLGSVFPVKSRPSLPHLSSCFS